MRLNPRLLYLILAIVWIAIVAWQIVEHRRMDRAVHEAQLNRAHDIATSLAVVIRSQRRFGTVPRSRLVSALEDLANSSELLGIAMLNPAGEVIASGGQGIDGPLADLAPGDVKRADGRLMVASLVELGEERMPRVGPGGDSDGERVAEDGRPATAIIWSTEEPPPRERPAGEDAAESTLSPEEERALRRARWERMRQMHPHFQSPERYQEMYERQGLHMMVLLMDIQQNEKVLARDGWFRAMLAGVALLAAGGLGLAWSGVARSSQLQIRLARARAQNAYLRELNLAAAGLAHETRNPLNIVRSITQMTASDEQVPPRARAQLGRTLEEVDRITARLNEFIDYSRPREPHLSPVKVTDLARDVARTLETDFEDKRITFTCDDSAVEVLADPEMLRQVVFNLLLNSSQAVGEGGHIGVAISQAGSTVELEVVDDGPGVPPAAREDIFRPYFTLSDHGSGLGLAVVRQIVLAHGWEISCDANGDVGSRFRIRGIELPGRERS